MLKSARAGGKTELVPPFDFVSVKLVRTHLGSDSLQRTQLEGWSKEEKNRIRENEGTGSKKEFNTGGTDAKSKLKLMCGEQGITEITVQVLIGSGFLV